MNWLWILIILVVSGNVVWGYSKGAIRVIYSMIAWILMLVLVTFATPYVEKWMVDHTGIDEKIERAFEKKLHEMVEKGVWDEENKSEEAPAEEIEEYEILFSDDILDKLLDGSDAVDVIMEKSGAYNAMVENGTTLAMRGIAFLLTLLILSIIFHIVLAVFDFISKLPLIEEVNNLLGAAVGFVKGIFAVWLMFTFVAIESTSVVGEYLLPLIYESPVLLWLYENNVILSLFLYFIP